MINAKDYDKGCKTVSQVYEQMVKALTHGDAFRYIDEPEKRAESRKHAEQYALQLLDKQMDTLPPKIKRDIVIIET